MDKLKILVVTTTYPSSHRNYIATFVHKWAKQLEKSGCEILVFTINSITLGTYLRSMRDVLHFYRTPKLFTYSWDGIDVKGVRFHSVVPSKYQSARINPFLTYKAIWPEIVKIRSNFPFNLIYLATEGALSLAMSRIAGQIGVPSIVGAIGGHVNMSYQQRGSRKFQIEREIFVNSELVVCVSEDMERKVRLMTDGLADIMTFYAGVDVDAWKKDLNLREEYRKKLSCKSNDKVVLFVGHIIRAKGIYELLEVFGKLYECNKSLHLVLVGNPTNRSRVMTAIKRLGIMPAVTLTGGVPPKEVIGWMNAGDLFVFPSWSEGLPNAVMEACACELPVIASDVGGIPEIIEDEVSGLLIKTKDKMDLTKKILRLLASTEEALVFGKKARKKVVRKFDYNKNGYVLVRRLESIISLCRSVAASDLPFDEQCG